MKNPPKVRKIHPELNMVIWMEKDEGNRNRLHILKDMSESGGRVAYRMSTGMTRKKTLPRIIRAVSTIMSDEWRKRVGIKATHEETLNFFNNLRGFHFALDGIVVFEDFNGRTIRWRRGSRLLLSGL